MKIDANTSYLIGFAQTDGHLSSSVGNKGRFTIELSEKDADIIYKISELIPYNYTIFKRKRKTNFSDSFKCIGLRVYNQCFRQWLNQSGVPYGKKSDLVTPPTHIEGLSINDYVRGLWDGDGSVGYTSSGLPFLSFITRSVYLKSFIESYISQVVGNSRHHFNRSKRDNTYNIMVSKEDAVIMAYNLYPKGCMGICRKIESAEKVKAWKRPYSMFKVTWDRKRWTKNQDVFLLTNGVEATMKRYVRTKKSVSIRLWRLIRGH